MRSARFDVYALGTRMSLTRVMARELSHWCDPDERVLGVVILDLIDRDHGWMLLARDRIGRFRCVDLETSIKTEHVATERLRARIARAVREEDIQALGFQDDETNYATDVLTVPVGTDPTKLHPFFRILLEAPNRHPSRSILREVAPWLAPSDPHFVSEFQFRQFDQRLWEMYLWAAFRELRFDVTQPEAPDFLCQGPGFDFTVEATTVGPSTDGVLAEHPDPKSAEEMEHFLAHYMPMKFGSALRSKLDKRDKSGRGYWERGAAGEKLFLIAVADFHMPGGDGNPGSMSYTQSAVWPYLYGRRVEWQEIDGQLIARAVRGNPHVYRGKVVETGFFDLPGSENVSAVLFTNAGTLAKFDRMGLVAGFEAPGYTYLRHGIRFNSDPDAVRPIPFVEDVGGQDYRERWTDELQVFHNPNARRPLDEDVFAGVTQHFFRDGQQVSIIPEGVVLSSRTMILGVSEARPGEGTL